MNKQEILNFLKTKKVVAFMPALNEENRIGNVLKEMPDYIQKTIVVDDGSTDKTAEVSKKYGAIVVSHESNSGSGAAYKTGFKTALELGADYVVLIHSDGQHDPEEIIDMFEPIVSGRAEYTSGARVKMRHKSMPLLRYIGNGSLSLMWSIATGYWLMDALTGFHVITKDALEKLHPERWSNDYMVETDMLEDVALNGIKIEEVPSKCIYNGSVSLVKPLKDGTNYGMRATGAFIRRIKKKLGFNVIIPDSSKRIWKPRKPSKF